MGMAAAGSVMDGQPATCKEVPSVIKMALASAQFSGTAMALEIRTLDRNAIIAAFGDGPDFTGTPLAGDLWWERPEPGSPEEETRPTWWDTPSSTMVRSSYMP